MKMEASLHHRMEQQLRLAPQIIQSIEILQLQALDLQELVKQELMENEVLEESGEDGISAREDMELQKATGEDVTERPDHSMESMDSIEDWNEYFRHERSGKFPEAGERDKKLDAISNTASRPQSLQDHLFDQLCLLEVDPRIKLIGEHIVYNIDENGYLRYDLSEIHASFDHECTAEEFREALCVIRRLEPRGVGGRDARESLILQLDPGEPAFALKRRILEEYLPDLMKNRLPKIARETGEDIDDIKALIGELSGLDPTPGGQYGSERPHYIHPDVVVEWVNGHYEVRLEDGYLPDLRVSPSYVKMFEKSGVDPNIRDYLRKKIDSARWLIESVEQRQNTLYRVCVEIVEHQKEFLDRGMSYLMPLKMQSIADRIGIHVSTVSRAISGKYMQTHRGIYPLKFFFTGATGGKGAGLSSRASVKGLVEEMINGEDRRCPLSDDDIALRLKNMGLPIARRTVTKYRKALSLPSSRQRKQY